VTLDARQSSACKEVAVLQLRKERERRGWSLTYVTRRTGIAANDLSMLERELRPAFPRWRSRIARAFGLPEDRLFRPADDPPAETTNQFTSTQPPDEAA
jgi:transcriptional regulator with XRE-family HTH domain